MKIRKTVGIDLGTTNSAIALLDATDSAIITGQDVEGRKIFPSVVGYSAEDQRPIVGAPAARLKGLRNGPVSSVKRFMGLESSFSVGPDRLTPPDVSARILRYLRDVLARTLGDDHYLIDSAIIAMPAYFNHNQIEATRQAGELAGYEVRELLHEPTAAAIYYSWILGHADATYLVYDLGGGTFDVSIIRKRYGDYEVLSVSGDPFLGGDDFDRLLASHLQGFVEKTTSGGVNFDLTEAEGAANFARLVHVAEGIKIELSSHNRVERYIPDLIKGRSGTPVALEAAVDRVTMQRLIKGKVDRTIECCHEALGRARDRAGIRLGGIDHIILVGGSSKIPLVRDTVRAAFCNPELPEQAKNPEPLLHEPDLCVAYGAALRGATYGTRLIFDWRLAIGDWPAEAGKANGSGAETAGGLELHITSPCHVYETAYALTGIVREHSSQSKIENRKSKIDWNGFSVRLECLATGLVEEAFLDERGTFSQDVELAGHSDNVLQMNVCDGTGQVVASAPFRVCHRERGGHLGDLGDLGAGVLPTQIITKPLQIEVLNRARQRIKHVLAPVGACLPGTFACTCRTVDQSGRIVVPIFEENRPIKHLIVERVDPRLPVGSGVEVEADIDVKHNIQVRVKVLRGELSGKDNRDDVDIMVEDLVTTAYIEAPPPPQRPTKAEIEAVTREIDDLIPELSGSYRTRVASQKQRLLLDLREALTYEDEPKAIQRMAELRDLLGQLQVARAQTLDPPWPRFAQLVKTCLFQAGHVADRTGRARDELFEQVYAQERYAERAYEERNQTLYRECYDNLAKLAGYLDQLLHDALPRSRRGPGPPPEEEARLEIEALRDSLAALGRKVRGKGRSELEERLAELGRRRDDLPGRIEKDPYGVIREIRRLQVEMDKIEDELTGAKRSPVAEEAGLLEGNG